MSRIKTGSLLLNIAVAVTFLGCACSNSVNKPPKSEEPLPPAHDGVYISDQDTLFFDGDSKSIRWHFAHSIEGLSPEGEGTYVFLFDKKSWRYDAAETLDIFSSDGSRSSFKLGTPGSCSSTAIPLMIFETPESNPIEKVFKLDKPVR